MHCAIKFHCHVKALPRGVTNNPTFFLGNNINDLLLIFLSATYNECLHCPGVVVDTVTYMDILIKNRTNSALARHMQCHFPLTTAEVLW